MRRASLLIALGVGMLATAPLAAQRVSLDQADSDHDGLVSDEYVIGRTRTAMDFSPRPSFAGCATRLRRGVGARVSGC